MTQYLRGSFSVGAKPGESEEMEDNWKRTFGKPAEAGQAVPTEAAEGAEASRLVQEALAPIHNQVAQGLEENAALRAILKEVHRLARDMDAVDAIGTLDTIEALTREYA